MGTVNRWSGRETRLLRHALRLTVRGFAEDLGVCVRTVSKWEALGPALTPRPEIQAALDTMLRRARDEDRERFHSSAGAGDAPADSEHVTAALADARRHLDTSVVEYFRQQLSRLKDDGRGGSAVLPRLLGLLGAIHQHAGEVRAAGLHCELMAIGADCAEFAGWLYRDGNEQALSDTGA